MTQGKVLNLSVPQLPHLYNGDSNGAHSGVTVKIKCIHAS